MLLRVVSLCVLLLLSGAGCALHTPPQSVGELPYPPEVVGENTVIHVRTGYRLDLDRFLDLLGHVRVVYLSEIHNSPGVHRMQAAIIQGLAERYPGRVAVGMEMFPYTAQKVLDRWRRKGEGTDKEFQEIWKTYWGEKIDYYRPLIEVLEKEQLPIVGLNAPKSVVHQISRNGLENLPGGLRSTLPEMDLTDPYQKAYLASIFQGHPQGSGMLERFLLVQSFWEETMAEKAAEYLQSQAGQSKILVVIAGGDHIDYGFGIPRRLFRRLPVTYYTVKPRFLSVEQIPQSQFMDVKETPLPLQVADFVWYVYYQ